MHFFPAYSETTSTTMVRKVVCNQPPRTPCKIGGHKSLLAAHRDNERSSCGSAPRAVARPSCSQRVRQTLALPLRKHGLRLLSHGLAALQRHEDMLGHRRVGAAARALPVLQRKLSSSASISSSSSSSPGASARSASSSVFTSSFALGSGTFSFASIARSSSGGSALSCTSRAAQSVPALA